MANRNHTGKIKQCTKKCKESIQNLQHHPDQQNILSMINPELADNNMLLLSKNLDREYTNTSPTNDKRQHAPFKNDPAMASYNLHLTPTKTYKDAITPPQQTNNNTKEVIEPTYTPINWETKMEETRQTTIKECLQQTQQMITESVHQQDV